MQVVVGSLLTNYNQRGKGPVVVLLHGWGDSAKSFDKLAAGLVNDYTVVGVDLPGFGGTQAPVETWGVDEYATFVQHFLDKTHVKPYAFIAHSNGGTIAIRGLANGSLQAQKLVLLASAGLRDVYKGRRRSLRLAAKAAKLATYPLPKRLQTKLKKRAYKAVGSDLFVAEHLQETFKKVVTDDILADARKLTLPTVLIYGIEDTATPPRYGQLINQAIPGSTLHLLENATHYVHHDQPQAVQKIVQEFLSV